MKYKFSISVSKDQFFLDALKFSSVRNSDLISYKEFIAYFSGCDTITFHNLVIGINFTYGWMPTIFEFTSNDLDKCLPLLNKAKGSEMLIEDELNLLKSTFNNSLVGTSKLLHFINPEIYPIWDSRVYRYLTNSQPYHNRIGDTSSFLQYVEWVKIITQHPNFNNAIQTVENRVGYKMTRVRVAELIMYSSGSKK